ncbi:MAG: gliding motility-associated-like protein [Vicingaceae bacterium]|jgi:gliding motility-associated-like protein
MRNAFIKPSNFLNLGVFILLIFNSFSSLFAQHIFNYDTYDPNGAAITSDFDIVNLIAGESYCIEATGTYSIWPPYDWTAPCGTVENAPMFPSPAGFRTGYVGFDMEHYFSGPDNPRCSLSFPGPSNRIQFSLDNGLTWFFPNTATPFNTNHTYYYQIVGMGFPLGVRQTDFATADDYGILRFTMQKVPEVDLGADTTLCQNASLVLDATTQNASYLWQDNSTAPAFNVSQPGTYWVDITINGCSASDTIIVDYSNLTVDLGADTSLCLGGDLTLNANTANASYRWQDNSTAPFFFVNQAGTYWVDVEVNSCIISDTIIVNLTNLQLNLGADTGLCPGSNLILDATIANATYSWQDNSSASAFNVSQAGKYWVDVEVNSCKASDTIQVDLIESSVNLGKDTSICPGELFTLNATAPFSTYQWQDNSTNSFLRINKEGVYWVDVVNQCGTVSDTINIASNNCGECYFYTPNAFTPNNDNINDTFFPKSECDLTDFELTIYNRWGELMFKTNNISEGWDGKINNELASTAVYVYSIVYTPEGKTPKSTYGRITLFR